MIAIKLGVCAEKQKKKVWGLNAGLRFNRVVESSRVFKKIM